MKTEIKINDKNLSRYSKRLQKILSEQLNKEIQLNEAANLLAKVLGVDSSFELNKILTKDIVEDFKNKLKQSSLTSLEKIILIAKQVQKMLKNTNAEFWYATFTHKGGGCSPFIGKPEFNGVEIYSDYIGFVPFDYKKALEVDLWLSNEEELSSSCIQYGNVEEYFEWKQSIKATHKEIKGLKELADFCQELMWMCVNETQSSKDFWLVEKDKITIGFGTEIKEIKD